MLASANEPLRWWLCAQPSEVLQQDQIAHGSIVGWNHRDNRCAVLNPPVLILEVNSSPNEWVRRNGGRFRHAGTMPARCVSPHCFSVTHLSSITSAAASRAQPFAFRASAQGRASDSSTEIDHDLILIPVMAP